MAAVPASMLLAAIAAVIIPLARLRDSSDAILRTIIFSTMQELQLSTAVVAAWLVTVPAGVGFMHGNHR